MNTRAIILAAGRGSRLGACATGPKCLLDLGGTSLLERQIAIVQLAGVERITVVAGYQAASVVEVCGGRVEVLENVRFAETNSLYSLWLARPLLSDGFVVLNGDVLFHPQLLSDLLSSRHEDALLVAFRDAATEPFGDEEMKVQVRGGRVVDIAKTLPPCDSDGENVGIAKFSPAGARLLVEHMDRLVLAGCVRDWAPRAFQSFARSRALHAVGTRGFPWIEIDFPEDYRRANDSVLPLIEAASGDAHDAGLLTPVVARDELIPEWRPESRHV